MALQFITLPHWVGIESGVAAGVWMRLQTAVSGRAIGVRGWTGTGKCARHVGRARRVFRI